jgi:hypothetical protein
VITYAGIETSDGSLVLTTSDTEPRIDSAAKVPEVQRRTKRNISADTEPHQNGMARERCVVQ